jgi:S-adenosylmethionine hydrolase
MDTAQPKSPAEANHHRRVIYALAGAMLDSGAAQVMQYAGQPKFKRRTSHRAASNRRLNKYKLRQRPEGSDVGL